MTYRIGPECRRWSGVCVLVLTVVVASLSEADVAPAQESDAEIVKQAKSLSRAFRRAAKISTPSVVTIIATVQPKQADGEDDIGDLLNDPRFRGLIPKGVEIPKGFRLPRSISSVGSGIIIDKTGIILTNSHVLQGADKVIVRFFDGSESEATNIKADPKSDLAVLQVNRRPHLKAATFGDSDTLEIGDWVIAVGSPFELEATVSAGIISGKGRSIGQIERGKLLQTDAAINPGNSGGPLVDLDGRVVGINTAIASNSGGYQGIGFAIPSNHAKWVVDQLVTHGRVQRAYLGIHIDSINATVARKLGVGVRSGVVVHTVIPASPAADAGLQKDDVIIEFAGTRVRTPRDLQAAVEQKPIDSTQRVKVIRDGKPNTLRVVLKELSDTFDSPKAPESDPDESG